jgi:hypothetical protein
MAQPATNRTILTKLDDQAPTAFYWQLTLEESALHKVA